MFHVPAATSLRPSNDSSPFLNGEREGEERPRWKRKENESVSGVLLLRKHARSFARRRASNKSHGDDDDDDDETANVA